MIVDNYYRFKLMRLITSKWLSKPMLAAVELELADIISDKKVNIHWIANKTKTQPDLLYRLLRTLTSMGIFKELDDKNFVTTTMAKLLKKEALGTMVLMFQSDWHDKAWNMLTETIKTSTPGFELAHGCTAFTWFKNNQGASESYNNANNAKVGMISQLFDKYKFKNINTITDIGGGYGGLLIPILKKHIHLHGKIYDLGYLESKAIDKINEHNLADRCTFIKGDFLNDIPVESDAYILSNILHDWNDDQCNRILKNCYNIMKQESILFIVEMIVPEGNGASISKFMDLEVLVMGGGKERTKKEFTHLLHSVNFKVKKISKKKHNYNIIECTKISGNNFEYKL